MEERKRKEKKWEERKERNQKLSVAEHSIRKEWAARIEATEAREVRGQIPPHPFEAFPELSVQSACAQPHTHIHTHTHTHTRLQKETPSPRTSLLLSRLVLESLIIFSICLLGYYSVPKPHHSKQKVRL